MKFEQALKLIEEQNILFVKVEDFNKKRLVNLEASTAPQLVVKLTQYRDSLSGYGKVIFICADEKIKNSSWRDAYNWQVTVSDIAPQINLNASHSGIVPPGYVSALEASLQAQLGEMKVKAELNQRMADLEAKLSKPASSADEIFKFFPMLGLFMDIDEKKITQMMGLAQLSTAMNNPTPVNTGVNGLQEKTVGATKVETTKEEEEMLDKIEDSIVSLTGKVPMEDILLLINKLNEKPELAKTLKAMM
jgi:hypothetical protein